MKRIFQVIYLRNKLLDLNSKINLKSTNLTGLSFFLAKGFLSMLMTCVDFFLPIEDWLMESSGLARVSIIIFVVVSQTGDSSQPDPDTQTYILLKG